MGFNAIAMAVVLLWAIIAARPPNPQQEEDWTGVYILIAAAFLTFKILMSLGIGIGVALARISKPILADTCIQRPGQRRRSARGQLS